VECFVRGDLDRKRITEPGLINIVLVVKDLLHFWITSSVPFLEMLLLVIPELDWNHGLIIDTNFEFLTMVWMCFHPLRDIVVSELQLPLWSLALVSVVSHPLMPLVAWTHEGKGVDNSADKNNESGEKWYPGTVFIEDILDL
jgi:hypothetical protein